eukprot:g1509.t1
MLASVPSTSSEAPPLGEPSFLVCVHIGAGYHAIEKERAYRRLMSIACRAAGNVLTESNDPLQAVTAAISILEDSPLTNAGYGANLNFEGRVECDASIMLGSGIFGAIGAAPGVQNPINSAALIAKLSTEPLPFGRVRPIFLAGDGARKWSLNQGLTAASDESAAALTHVTEEAICRWKTYHEMLKTGTDSVSESPVSNEDCTIQKGTVTQKTVNDTVGCIVVNTTGEMCAGVSSGGIEMKTPGRVGEAAIYGAGCWARNAERKNDFSVACSVSGVGEIITRGLTAKTCAESLVKASPLDFTKKVIQSQTEELSDPKDIGVISLRSTVTRKKSHSELHVELGVVHNSESMGFAYLTANAKPITCFLRHDSTNGSIAEFGTCAKWPLTDPDDK